MRYATSTTIEAPAEQVWAVIRDVSAWPDWTPTVVAVRSDQPALALGAHVTVTQPGRRPTEYVVDEYVEGSRFRWSRDRGGVIQYADHVVTPVDAGRCTVDLTFEMAGPLGGVLGRLGATTIRRMVEQEAASLKQEAETTRPAEGPDNAQLS